MMGIQLVCRLQLVVGNVDPSSGSGGGDTLTWVKTSSWRIILSKERRFQRSTLNGIVSMMPYLHCSSTNRLILGDCLLGPIRPQILDTIKFLNFRTPENFAVI